MAGIVGNCVVKVPRLVNVIRCSPASLLFLETKITAANQQQRRNVSEDATTSKSASVSMPESSDVAVIEYEFGLPVVILPLPSRKERCQFTLKPVTQTVGDFCRFVRSEDKGVETVAIYKIDGKRMSNSTPLEHLFQMDKFHIRINDNYHSAEPPPTRENTELTSEHMKDLDDLKATVAALHAALNIDDHRVHLEAQMVKKLEECREQLRPFERTKALIDLESEKRSSRAMWFGLGAMGLQMGIFGRLTWWEYSWDIMEPVTYFATFATGMAAYAYYVVTKQVYEYDQAEARVHLTHFHRRSSQYQFDVDKYNRLRQSAMKLEQDLDRLRDPLAQHLPAARLAAVAAAQQHYDPITRYVYRHLLANAPGSPELVEDDEHVRPTLPPMSSS